MNLLLTEKDWLISYSSNENNPIADFYIPALESAVAYDRKSGFFNSAILSKVAQGLGAMLYNEGKMRLIMGCEFSHHDLKAIALGYELKEKLEYGLPEQLNKHKLFHEKTGIFTDREGNKIAFSGSNNESIGGWETNVESFHVYCAWEGERDLQRVNEEQFRFDKLWNNLAENVRVFEIPEAIKKKLLRYTPPTKPIWTKEDEFNYQPIGQTEEVKDKREKENTKSPDEINPQIDSTKEDIINDSSHNQETKIDLASKENQPEEINLTDIEIERELQLFEPLLN